MANSIHFSEKELGRMESEFKKASETEALFSHDLDETFSGAKTVHVKILKTEPLQDYNKNQQFSSGSRYGNSTELGDFEQTYTMAEDKSLSLTVDLGNNQDQLNMKQAGKVISAHRDEQIVPYLDKYRIGKWAKEAGVHKAIAQPTKSNIASAIIAFKNDLLESGVPDDIVLLVPYRYMETLALSDEWVKLDRLGGETLPKGTVAKFFGMPVKPITSNYFGSSDVYFMLLHKKSVIAPMKIQKFNLHKDPPGLSGDLIEFRMRHDAFVLGYRAKGVGVACASTALSAAPTISISSNSATITVTDGGTIFYTLDGSDPRYSVDKVQYSSAVDVPVGATIKAYAVKTGKFWSDVTEATNA